MALIFLVTYTFECLVVTLFANGLLFIVIDSIFYIIAEYRQNTEGSSYYAEVPSCVRSSILIGPECRTMA